MSMTSGSIVAFSPVLLKLLLITVDAYYGWLSTAKLLLELKHYFILSCKGNYPFKQHTLAHLSDQKGPSVCGRAQRRGC